MAALLSQQLLLKMHSREVQPYISSTPAAGCLELYHYQCFPRLNQFFTGYHSKLHLHGEHSLQIRLHGCGDQAQQLYSPLIPSIGTLQDAPASYHLLQPNVYYPAR